MLADLLAFNFLLALLLIVAWWILDVIGKWFMFAKMGEAGWKSIIPIFSDYIIFKRVWQPVYFIVFVAVNICSALMNSGNSGDTVNYLANLLNCAAFVIAFLENIKLSRSFGHGYLFALGLLIFNPLFTMILGFGSSVYLGNFSTGKYMANNSSEQ